MRRKRTGSDAQRHRAVTTLQALGIVAVYFMILLALMYPVARAAGYLV